MKFKLLVGTAYLINPSWKDGDHTHPNGHVNRHHPDRMIKHVAPCIVESERQLDEIYVNKFERVLEGNPIVITEARRAAVNQLIQDGACTAEDRDFLEPLSDDHFERTTRLMKPRPLAAMTPLGQEVTHEFQRAYDEGFRVWKNDKGKYAVTRGPDIIKAISPKPFEAREVERWIDLYLKEGGK